jgi:hypothetical protein
VGAGVLGQVPKTNAPAAVAADDLALVRVDHDIIDRRAVVVAPPDGATARVPYLDSAILGARHHPFAVTVECYASDIAGMALENRGRSGIRGADVEQLDRVMAGSGEKALVGGDAESVDLRIGVLDGPRADPRESLPESETRCVSTMVMITSGCSMLGAYLIVWS